jgi:hypothetical protein
MFLFYIMDGLSRPITAAVATVIALTVLGSGNLPAMEWAKQAAAGGVAIYVADMTVGDADNMSKWMTGPAVSGATFAVINKMLYGSGDTYVTLFVGGAAIDAAASAIQSPLSSALGM